MGELGTILGVWAHPDDETYLTAGLMADAVASGDRVVCVTATKGEGGSWDEKRWPSEKMGAVRDAELMESLRILGVTEHHWLGYMDGSCHEVPIEEGTAKVQAIMEQVAPDTVMTFGPDGMTGHKDHQAVCAWTTEAFRRAAPADAKLYYATTTQEWADEFVPRMNKFNVFEPGYPPISPPEDVAIERALGPELLDRKLQAIEAHVSQVEYMLRYFGEDFFREAHKIELFRLAETR
ncbi:MAG: PIG-L deacetylase family protein [Actinomycetota bacterium]